VCKVLSVKIYTFKFITQTNLSEKKENTKSTLQKLSLTREKEKL